MLFRDDIGLHYSLIACPEAVTESSFKHRTPERCTEANYRAHNLQTLKLKQVISEGTSSLNHKRQSELPKDNHEPPLEFRPPASRCSALDRSTAGSFGAFGQCRV